jgi:hypothetical protein
MLLDYEDQVCRAQAFTATAVSASSIDMSSASSDFTIGRQMSGLVIPTVAAGAGSTHVLAVIQADDAALTSNVEVLGSITVLAAALTVGSVHEIPIPKGVKTRRYIGLRNTISSGTTTVTADGWIVPSDEIPKYKSFTKVVHADNN